MLSVFYFIVGACVGSFIPCFAERRYKHAFQTERSHCTNCQKTIAPLYLIPILGYFLSHGRCHFCQVPIPKSLPILEAAGALVGLILSFQASNPIHLLLQLLIVSLLLLMSFDDYYTQWIHDSDLLLYAVLILIDGTVFSSSFLIDRILGMGIIALPLLIIHYRFPLALGSGDILFMAASGFYLGIVDTTYAFFIGIVTALLYSVTLLIQGKATKETAIPLIPFLSIGVLSMTLF